MLMTSEIIKKLLTTRNVNCWILAVISPVSMLNIFPAMNNQISNMFQEEQTTGWERFSFKESSYIKTQLEDRLSIKIFEMLPKAGVAAVEGTVSVVIDNSQVILFHVDKVCFSGGSHT